MKAYINGKYAVVVGFGGITYFDTKEEADKYEAEIAKSTKRAIIFSFLLFVVIILSIPFCDG